MSRNFSRRRVATGLCLTVAGSAFGQGAAPAEDDLQEVVVYGRAEHLIGTAAAASEGSVGGADLAVRPLLRVAELLEAVPGLIAVQHSGSGKANQYFLRGFNLDHGTDFATYIDDVPLNLRTHGHGQGYLDVNGLIPEMVERIDFRKGPYRADLGDNALAGAALLSTVARVPDPFMSLEAGSYDYLRAAAGGTSGVGDGELTLIGEWKSYNGPWELPEELRHFSGMAKFAQQTDFGSLELGLSSYLAAWQPTEQIPERAIGTSICEDAFCELDDTATGDTTRHILTFRLKSDDWRATAYAQYYNWNMYSDATYDYQIRQWDRRMIYGARGSRDFATSERLQFSVGGEARYDDIDKVQVDHTEDAVFVEHVGAHSAKELSLAAFAEANWHVTDSVRLLAGVRADYYDFQTHATQPGFDEGSANDDLVSPKLGAAWEITDSIEAYANWGRGFHSNDARGVTSTLLPVEGLVPGEGKEVGARLQRGSLSLTATYWWLDVDSELSFVGDSNSVEPRSGSERRGYELVGFWRPVDSLALDAVWTQSHARYVDSPGEDHIAGAVESAGEFGASFIRGPWELSGRVRYLGPYPLIEDNSLRAASETIFNVRAAWKSSHWMLYGELLNVFDDDGKDIVYYYESYLPAIDAAPTEGRMSRISEPRTLRVGLRYSF